MDAFWSLETFACTCLGAYCIFSMLSFFLSFGFCILYFLIFWYFPVLYFAAAVRHIGEVVKACEPVPVWASLPALKRTNQHFSYFMRSLRAVCISLQEKPNSSAWPIHGACTVHHCDQKQTSHFNIYHSRCTTPLWALTKTEFLTFTF